MVPDSGHLTIPPLCILELCFANCEELLPLKHMANFLVFFFFKDLDQNSHCKYFFTYAMAPPPLFLWIQYAHM